MDHIKAPRGLDRAMQLFWKQGPGETAYNQIVAATGLSRKALYGTWPDKGRLVRATLEHYRDTVLGPRLALLDPPGAAALGRYWTALEEDARRPGWCGCYLMRSAADAARADRTVRAIHDRYVAALQEAFVHAILAACRELPRSRVLDAGAAAWAAVAIVTQASALGAASGYDDRVAELYRAGRVACGLPPA